MIRALVVDDEPYAREELRALLAPHADFLLIGSCGNAVEALKAINQERPDVVFLDIQMPRISGLELLGMLDSETVPRIVFVTAFDEYAVAAFEENAFDSLLKPIEPDRFEKTVNRLRRVTGQPQQLGGLEIPPLAHIPCYAANRIRLIRIGDVEYAYTDISGVHVVTAEGISYTDLTLKVLEERTDLIRCHRQNLVRLDMVREIRLLDNGCAEITTRSGQQVPVSRRHLRDLKSRLGFSA
jgi:two-component system LytT family response regulator